MGAPQPQPHMSTRKRQRWFPRISHFLLCCILGGAGCLQAAGLDGSEDVYLSLSHATVAKCGWGTAHDNASVTGNPMQMGSALFDRGIGTHAPAELVFHPEKHYRWLTFFAGISDEMIKDGSATVQVWLDGKLVFETPVLRVKEEPRYVSLPVAGVEEIRLVGTDGGNNTAADHINLGNLRLSVAAAAPEPETLRHPTGATPVLPRADLAARLPRHGTASVVPAKKWEDSLVAGNGIMGALLAGDPVSDKLIVNHCKLWLPLGSREIVPDLGNVLPEWRRVIGEKGYEAGHKFFLERARQQGWDGHLVWTDPFHPGFVLRLEAGESTVGQVRDYARFQDYAKGEAWVEWRTDDGEFSRHMFVSRTENVAVLQLTAPPGKLTCKLWMDPVSNTLIRSSIRHQPGLIAAHNVYVKGKGGYDAAVRVTAEGGKVSCEGETIRISGADSALLVMRIEPWKTPLEGSEAWPYSPENPDFEKEKVTASQRAFVAYQPRVLEQLQQELTAMSTDYRQLLARHAAAHGAIFNRVSLDLNADPAERVMSSEALLDLAKREQRLPAALLERMYDAGRFVFLCSAGPDTPPNLFGIWTGTWQPAWSGDYTLDTNLQLDIQSALSGNMAEALAGYFNLMESFLPDFRTNARKLYGCRGILSGSRASNTGIHLHWDQGWPGEIWTPGAAWLAHWFYDYYLYTGDETFLRERAIPWMKECAEFYEDFLRGTENAQGHYTFRPSFSAENGWADNATQDISICRELLGNLIAACETLKLETAGVARWRAMLEKLPPYLINEEGQLQEWSTPGKAENNNHRHLMHLYGAFESDEFNEEADPKLYEAARVALRNRLKFAKETSAHGYMHSGLAATALNMPEEAYGRLKVLATERSMYPSLVTSHEPGPQILCDDANGAIPQIVNRMLAQSKPGRLALLPALPSTLPRGEIRGIRAKGQLGIDRLAWDTKAGTLQANVTSPIHQEFILVLPYGAKVDELQINGAPQAPTPQGVGKQGCKLVIGAHQTLTISARFRSEK